MDLSVAYKYGIKLVLGNVFIDSSPGAELIKLIKLQLMHLQLESNMISDDYKQYIKQQPLTMLRWGIYNTAARLNIFFYIKP